MSPGPYYPTRPEEWSIAPVSEQKMQEIRDMSAWVDRYLAKRKEEENKEENNQGKISIPNKVSKKKSDLEEKITSKFDKIRKGGNKCKI